LINETDGHYNQFVKTSETTNADTVRRFRSLLRALERETIRPFDSRNRCCGLTLSQCHTLLEIGRRGEIFLVDLAGVFGLDASTLSRTIQGLVQAGLVDRRPGERDRRYIVISLSGKGQAVFRDIERRFDERAAAVLERIPAPRREAVFEAAALIAGAVRAENESSGCCPGGKGNASR